MRLRWMLARVGELVTPRNHGDRGPAKLGDGTTAANLANGSNRDFDSGTRMRLLTLFFNVEYISHEEKMFVLRILRLPYKTQQGEANRWKIHLCKRLIT